ncbi:MAG: DUF2905 domain-containing protein [Gammaproteobacteria bacterium]
MGRTLILIGIAFLVAGVLFTVAPGLFSWFGRLPGDLRIETKTGVIFIPVTSMIVASLALTLVVNLFFRR